jgi:hypothetical protein
MEIDKLFFAARCIAIIIDILYNNEKEAAVFYLDLDTPGLSENKAGRRPASRCSGGCIRTVKEGLKLKRNQLVLN